MQQTTAWLGEALLVAGAPEGEAGAEGCAADTSVDASVDQDADTREFRVSAVDAEGFAALVDDWEDLCRRAGVANVFMDPAVAVPVAAKSSLRVLLAWSAAPGEPSAAPVLIGAWLASVQPTRLSWPFRCFASPVTPVAYLGSPVVDAAFQETTFQLFLALLRADPALPKLVQLGDVNASLMPTLTAALAMGRMPWRVIEARQRARLLPFPDPDDFWASTRSKAHQKDSARLRRRLSEVGRLTVTVHVEPDEVAGGLEEFLRLEKAGWKGARGSALASDKATADTVRAMLAGLAGRGLVKIHAMRLDGRAIAMSILLYSGREAFTWRIAYDEDYRRFSPGIMLLEEVTFDLLRDTRLVATDSCNHREKGFQAERWPARHDLLDLLIDVRAGPSWRVAVLAARERFLRRAKEAIRPVRAAVLARFGVRPGRAKAN